MARLNIDTNPPHKLPQVFTIIGLLIILVAGFIGRSWVPYDYVFGQPETTRLVGVDPFFHLRQAQYSVNHFPDIQRWDYGAHFPKGLKNDAAGLFDLTIATVTLGIYGSNATTGEIATIAAWISPVLNLFACILLYLLGRSLIGRWGGLACVAAFLLYPGDTLDRSILGFADHHSAEYLLALAITLGLVHLLKANRQSDIRPWWQPAFIAASPFILLAYTWKGAAVYFPVVGFALFLYWTVALFLGEAPQRLARAGVRYGLALLIAFIIIHFGWSELELYPRGIHWMFAGAIAMTLGSWVYLTLAAHLSKKYGHVQVALSGFTIIMTSVVLILTATSVGQDIASALFGERTTLVREQATVTLANYFAQLGTVGILALPGFLIGLYMVYKKQLALEALIPLGLGSGWLLIWWQSGDFAYTPPPFLAFSAITTLYAIFKMLQPKQSGKWRMTAGVATIIIMILPIYPLKQTKLPWLDDKQLATIIIYEDYWFEAMKWLTEHTPQPTRTPTSSSLIDSANQTSRQPDYGIMASWDFGNIIASYGNRIPVASRFPSNKVPRWTMAQSEQTAMKWLCPKCNDNQSARYAIADGKTYGPFFYAKNQMIGNNISARKNGEFDVKGQKIPHISFGRKRKNSMIGRLYAKNGNELSHYRLVYESPALEYGAAFLQLFKQNNEQKFNFSLHRFAINNTAEHKRYSQWIKADIVTTGDGYLYDDAIEPSIKIFEIVKGEQISGDTQPGATVQARLNLKNQISGHQFKYTRTTKADETGHYTLTVPYPIAIGKPDNSTTVFATQPYQVFIKKPGSGEYLLDKVVQ